jgi:hypothetical protein
MSGTCFMFYLKAYCQNPTRCKPQLLQTPNSLQIAKPYVLHSRLEICLLEVSFSFRLLYLPPFLSFSLFQFLHCFFKHKSFCQQTLILINQATKPKLSVSITYSGSSYYQRGVLI